MTTILQVKNLFKSYGAINAVNGLNLSIKKGSCLGILGPNGAGKTTTIEIIEGIQPPTSGEVLYKGKPITDKFKQEAGIQFQATALQEFLTVEETLSMFHRLYEKTIELTQLIKLCSLSDILNRDVNKLSGGQRQRLLLALALVNDPEIIFLDEPTTGLDPQARRYFWELVKLIQKRDKTIVLTTHYMEEAYELCDEIAIIDQGKVIAEGSPEKLLHDHFDNTIIIIPLTETNITAIKPFADNYTVLDNWIEIQTTTPHTTIENLIKHGVSLDEMRLRKWNLEDLFISLTGKKLRL